jgi:TRAP-type mannitol/chloroaromatic compound transport system substrate-binding protein
MISEYMARNTNALRQLEADPNVEILAFPPAVLAGLKALTLEVVEGIAGQDPIFAKVWESYRAFLAQSEAWQRISEQAYLETRI